MTIEEIRKGAPEGATHYEIVEGETFYYARDYMGRWCYVEENGDLWPTSCAEMERLDKEAQPLSEV